MTICETCGSTMEKAKDEEVGIVWLCHKCKSASPQIEVYSRVVGYLRPIQQWNPGKQQEFDDRRVFKSG